MNNNPLNNFTDEVGEVIKKQLTPKPPPQNPNEPPPPSKKILNQLNQATTELSQVRLKKIREELDKQRLKIKKPKLGQVEETKKEVFDVVAQTLKNSKSTGEFGKNIGG